MNLELLLLNSKNQLNEKQLNSSLINIFNKHQSISYFVWFLISFLIFLPLSILNSISSYHMFFELFVGQQFPSYMFAFIAFLAPSLLTSILLSEFLPISKLQKNCALNGVFQKIIKKFPSLNSSCSTVNFKIQEIHKHINDIELNLSIYAFYEFLITLDFSKDEIIKFKNNMYHLSLIESSPDIYKNKFLKLILNFISDLEFYSKSKQVNDFFYQQKLLNHKNNISLSSDDFNNTINSIVESNPIIKIKNLF